MLLAVVCVACYTMVGEVEITFAQKANATDAQEATRKLKLLTDAQAANKNGFVRLSEAEINSLLQRRAGKADKNRTDGPVHLVKAGVILDEKEITFVTWHSVSLLGIDLPLVWQRSLRPNRSTNGWSLALRDMQVGKVRIPREFWAEPGKFLGATDSVFEEQKAW